MKFSEIKDQIPSLISRLGEARPTSPRSNERVEITKKLLEEICSQATGYDAWAISTCNNMGGVFLGILQSSAIPSENDINEIFVFVGRCGRERMLRIFPVWNPGVTQHVMNYYADQSKLTDREKMDAEYLNAGLLRELNLELWKTVENKANVIENSIKNWNSQRKELEKSLEQSHDLVKKYQSEFNFVGLALGFRDLAGSKRIEKRWAFGALLFLGICAVIPVGFQFWDKSESIFTISSGTLKTINFGKLIPLVVLETAILYFFRITLHNYYSAKAQLLQLELRFALCKFVESYANFAAAHTTPSGEPLLGKFESLIFSGIAIEPGKVPSTLDGVDQLAHLIGELKKGGKP